VRTHTPLSTISRCGPAYICHANLRRPFCAFAQRLSGLDSRHACTSSRRIGLLSDIQLGRALVHDSWSLSHLGHLYPGTTPVMIKLDHNRSCPWVKIAQVTKAPTIIRKVPAKGHTGSLPSTSLDHHVSLLVASRGNVSFTDPI